MSRAYADDLSLSTSNAKDNQEALDLTQALRKIGFSGPIACMLSPKSASPWVSVNSIQDQRLQVLYLCVRPSTRLSTPACR